MTQASLSPGGGWDLQRRCAAERVARPREQQRRAARAPRQLLRLMHRSPLLRAQDVACQEGAGLGKRGGRFLCRSQL
jgi:hypothetical protein